MTTFEFNYKLIGLKDQLFNFAFRLTANTYDAEDLLQDTFFKAIRARDSFEDNTNLKAWTHTIMKNTFINNYKRSLRSNTKFSYNIDLHNYNLRYISSADTKIAEKEIENEINKLEDKYKIPFLLYVKGYSYKEIAQEERIKLGTVKNRIYCARQKLINELKDYQ
jgi:RNA polymerase sigma factor (sigma-70 family)